MSEYKDFKPNKDVSNVSSSFGGSIKRRSILK